MNRSWKMKEAYEWIIITDLDGTITDSERVNFTVLRKLLDEFGYTEHRTTILRGLAEGREFEEIMKMINMTTETRRKMEKRMASLLEHTSLSLLPGAKENMRALRNLGLLFCIATDNYNKTVARVINEHDLNDIFESKFILTCDTFPVLKPSSDIVRELMKRSGRKAAIILGNTPKEVALARNSGCPVVIITDGKGIESKTARTRDTFRYEWEMYGGISGKDIYPVKNWEEVRNVIIEIIQKKSVEWYL